MKFKSLLILSILLSTSICAAELKTVEPPMYGWRFSASARTEEGKIPEASTIELSAFNNGVNDGEQYSFIITVTSATNPEAAFKKILTADLNYKNAEFPKDFLDGDIQPVEGKYKWTIQTLEGKIIGSDEFIYKPLVLKEGWEKLNISSIALGDDLDDAKRKITKLNPMYKELPLPLTFFPPYVGSDAPLPMAYIKRGIMYLAPTPLERASERPLYGPKPTTEEAEDIFIMIPNNENKIIYLARQQYFDKGKGIDPIALVEALEEKYGHTPSSKRSEWKRWELKSTGEWNTDSRMACKPKYYKMFRPEGLYFTMEIPYAENCDAIISVGTREQNNAVAWLTVQITDTRETNSFFLKLKEDKAKDRLKEEQQKKELIQKNKPQL